MAFGAHVKNLKTQNWIFSVWKTNVRMSHIVSDNAFLAVKLMSIIGFYSDKRLDIQCSLSQMSCHGDGCVVTLDGCVVTLDGCVVRWVFCWCSWQQYRRRHTLRKETCNGRWNYPPATALAGTPGERVSTKKFHKYSSNYLTYLLILIKDKIWLLKLIRRIYTSQQRCTPN